MDNEQNQSNDAASESEALNTATVEAANDANPTGADAQPVSEPAQASAEVINANDAEGVSEPIKPHEDGGATLQQSASAQEPQLVASAEVYRDHEGTLYLNLTHNNGSAPVTLPQQRTADSAEIRGAVDLFLKEHVTA